ncbi:hypothetical protein D3C71_2235010 [compost metagenome]
MGLHGTDQPHRLFGGMGPVHVTGDADIRPEGFAQSGDFGDDTIIGYRRGEFEG